MYGSIHPMNIPGRDRAELRAHSTQCAVRDTYCCDGLCTSGSCCTRPNDNPNVTRVIEQESLFDAAGDEGLREQQRVLLVAKYAPRVKCPSKVIVHQSTVNGSAQFGARRFQLKNDSVTFDACNSACSSDENCLMAVFNAQKRQCAHGTMGPRVLFSLKNPHFFLQLIDFCSQDSDRDTVLTCEPKDECRLSTKLCPNCGGTGTRWPMWALADRVLCTRNDKITAEKLCAAAK